MKQKCFLFSFFFKTNAFLRGADFSLYARPKEWMKKEVIPVRGLFYWIRYGNEGLLKLKNIMSSEQKPKTVYYTVLVTCNV